MNVCKAPFWSCNGTQQHFQRVCSAYNWQSVITLEANAAVRATVTGARPDVACAAILLNIPNEARLTTLADELCQAANNAVVVGWRTAERNLDWPAIGCVHALMRLRGKAAFEHYQYFLRRGGIEGFVARAGLNIMERQPAWGGAATLLVCSSPSAL